MHLANPKGVSFCVLDRRAIFLDVERDRYFALTPDQTQALMRAMRGTSVLGMDEALLQPLLNEGLLIVTEDSRRRLTPAATQLALREVEPDPTPQVGLMLTALLFQFRAYRALRRGGLAKSIAQRASVEKQPVRSRNVTVVAAAARLSDRLVSAHQRCLIKSFALFDILALSGHRPTLLLGVRDDPFAAHAWVQLDDLVVGDRLEHVRLFKPVLVI